MDTSNPFEASASALGYGYQFRYALKRAIDELRTGYDWSIRIEGADDLELGNGTFQELRQLKAVKRSAQLTDLSPDLWKTLRIWFTLLRDGKLDPPSTTLFLVTTGKVPEGSVAARFIGRASYEDALAADDALMAAGQKSTSDLIQRCYAVYSSTSKDERLKLLQRVEILDHAEDFEELREALCGDLRVGTPEDKVVELLERVEGWWFQACLECMANARDGIPAIELDSLIIDQRNMLRPDNLPVDADILADEPPEVEAFADRTFVRQAELATSNRRRLQNTVRDYLRASSQRSRWARRNLVSPQELDDYERRLQEDWDIIFQSCLDDLGSSPDEEAKSAVARQMITWAESAHMPIRPAFSEPFVCRGSYHMLADELRVGWHPEYMVRIMALVTDTSESAG
jgi:hypothetical protein